MIVCLGWGSLIWDAGELPVKDGVWYDDGPLIGVEYLRQSIDGRLTLVLDSEVPKVTSLWAEMKVEGLPEAKQELKRREGTIDRYIGAWESGAASPAQILGLESWAEEKGCSAVIWTNLPSKYDDEDFRKPTVEEVVSYMLKLDSQAKEKAENYIRKTPKQIETPFRKIFEKEFGWFPVSS